MFYPQIIHKKSKKEDEVESAAEAEPPSASAAAPAATTRKMSVRRRRCRVPDRPNISISLWSIVKNSIGKDLTKIPVPVNFSEPLSMLQRLNEDFEYSDILHHAAKAEDDCEQVQHMAHPIKAGPREEMQRCCC